MLDLAALLMTCGIAPANIVVLLHKPVERDLQILLPSFAGTRPAALEAYQAVHSSRAEATQTRGRAHVASFVFTGERTADGAAMMLFAGLFRNEGHRERPVAEVLADPEVIYLRDTSGAYPGAEDVPPGQSIVWIDLRRSDLMADYEGRIVVSAHLTQAYVRLAENLLGRWRDHVAGDVGVTAELRHRDPASFRFYILERVSPDLPIEEVAALEQTWTTRLHTKTHGLNR